MRESRKTIGIVDRDARLEIFAVCDGASDQNGRLSLVGTFEMIGSERFPFVLPQASVVVRIRFWPGEGREHAMRLALTDPDGGLVGVPFESQLTLRPNDNERSAAYNFIVQMRNLTIEVPGEYCFDLYLNGHLEGRLPLCIFPNDAVSVAL